GHRVVVAKLDGLPAVAARLHRDEAVSQSRAVAGRRGPVVVGIDSRAGSSDGGPRADRGVELAVGSPWRSGRAGKVAVVERSPIEQQDVGARFVGDAIAVTGVSDLLDGC